ncbi:hypothetical protein SISSUDRAFT_1067421, partial [Sistotremastrum suecicum HHB10207 ss-3]
YIFVGGLSAKGNEPSNFHTWKLQLKAVYQEKQLWDVVTGKEKSNIPVLVKSKTIPVQFDGVMREAKTIGNEAEYAQAVANNAAWVQKDRTAWRILLSCLDADSITSVDDCPTTATAWSHLFSYFSAISSRESGAILRQISNYEC